MSARLVTVLGFTLFSLSILNLSAQIIFDDGGIHTISTPQNSDVWVRNNTTVRVIDGASFDRLLLDAFTSAEISGGVGEAIAASYSNVNISGGVIESINANDGSTFDISDGIFNSVNSSGSSIINISGGQFASDIYSSGNSHIHISGGNFNAGLSYLNYTLSLRSSLSLYGSNFKVNGLDFGYGSIVGTGDPIRIEISGILADGNVFGAYGASVILDSFGTINLLPAAIPEPSTYAAILGGIALTGVVFFRRRKASSRSSGPANT